MDTELQARVRAAREALDAWVREIVAWHFSPETGCPFWLDHAGKLGWEPRRRLSEAVDEMLAAARSGSGPVAREDG